MRDPECRSRGGFIGGRWNALIERHHDVAPDRLLRLDAKLGAEQNHLTIEVTLKQRAFLAHGTRMRQGEDLEAAGIREHRTLPTHELVDPTHPAKDLGAWTKQQVVGICQQDLRAGVLERLGKLRLHSRLRADRHK
jgi:hypothetical protein